MTLTLTPSTRILTKRARKVKGKNATLRKARKSAMRRAGRTYYDLAALARVTYSMVWKWMNCERVSRPCEEAFRTLTNGGKR